MRKESKRSGWAPIAVWRENVKTHLWRSIKYCAGQGDMVRHVFNTCLMHVKDVHSWTMTPETSPYTRCNHGPLEGTRLEVMLEGSEAYSRFRNVVLNQRLQEDLTKASPYGGTSVCEPKNALDRLYCRKEIFYPISTYPFFIKLATMHFNCLRRAEIAGERTVEKRAQIQRKYLSRTSQLVSKTPVQHHWKDEILKEVLNLRTSQFESCRSANVIENVSAETAAVMAAEDAFDRLGEGRIPLDQDWEDIIQRMDPCIYRRWPRIQ